MSKWSDIKRAMRPAGMEDREFAALREATERSIPHATSLAGARIEIPGVTWGGKPYLLTVVVKAGRIFSFEVDHDPDLSAPAFEAYTEKRAEWEAEERAKEEQAHMLEEQRHEEAREAGLA